MLQTLCIRTFSTSVGVLPKMPAVAAEQFRVRCPQGASMPDDHQLHLTLVDVDQDCGAPVRVHEEDDGEERHLKLRAGPDEGTTDGLHQTVPAELEVQNVVVLIGLWTKKTTQSQIKIQYRENSLPNQNI